jgi:predicted Na+-dependent transporter
MLSNWEQMFLILMIFGLMIGIGCGIEVKKIKDIIKLKKSILVGLSCQYLLLPLFAIILIRALNIPSIYASALLLVACCPGGTTSNMFSYLSKSHVELSIFFTTLTSIFAFVMTPLLYRSFSLGSSSSLIIPFKEIALTLVFSLLPIFLGLLIKLKSSVWAIKVERWGSIIGYVSILCMIFIWIPKVFDIMKLLPPAIFSAVTLLCASGIVASYLVAKIFGLKRGEAQTIGFETGIQNAPLAFAILGLSVDKEIFHQISWVPLLYGAMSVGLGILTTVIFKYYPGREK